MRIRLTPCDYDFLRVHWRICGDNHYFFPSCVMGSQFSAFLTAVYRLYEEEKFPHTYGHSKLRNFTHEHSFEREDQKDLLTAKVFWDEEGFVHIITFRRHCDEDFVCTHNEPDPIHITITSGRKTYTYTVDGRDLCYAIARGCTEAIKKYGFTGYRASSGMQSPGDSFDVHELLFVKAYALGVLDARDIRELWSHPDHLERADSSSFEKELELLLFDM